MTRVPVLRLVRHAYLDLIGNWRGLVQVGGFWLILPWVLHALSNPLLALIGDLALTTGIAAVAVAWHRRLLLQEPLPQHYAPISSNVARYLGFSVLVILLAAVPSLVLVLALAPTLGATGGDQSTGLLPTALLGAAAVGSLLAAMRLQLVFPAAAIGERGMTLRRSWDATQGNGWRLLGGTLLVSLPPAIAGTVLAMLLDWLAESTGSLVLDWLSRLAPIAGAWVQAPLLAAFLSFVFLFVRQQAAPAPAVVQE